MARFLAVATISFWIVAMAYLGFRFEAIPPALEGVPVIVLRRGGPLTEVLRLERVTLDELRESARDQGIADLGDDHLAVLEPDGRFSFLSETEADERGGPEKHKA